MIEERGNDKVVKHDKELLNAFCKVSISDCRNAMMNFLSLLNLPKNALNHIFDTKVIIDYSDDYKISDMVSFYDVNENTIYVLGDYIDNIITNIDKSSDDISEDMKELATSLMHEYLHVNRDVILGDRGSVLSDLDPLLDYRLSQGASGKRILLNAIGEKDNYRVNIYNQSKNQYETYLLPKSSFNFNNINLQIKLNKIFKGLKPISVFKVSDECIIDNPNPDLKLEELLTELYARLIIYHNHKTYLDIDCFINYINRLDVPQELKDAAKLLGDMSLDDISWFLLSCYEDNYEEGLILNKVKQ